jgi:hypothetical protein
MANMDQSQPGSVTVARLAPWRHPADEGKWQAIEDEIARVYAWQRGMKR